MKNKIILFAGKKFEQFGFYKITMDELAKEMRISKKTIYKYFPSKNSLIKAFVDDIRFSIAEKIKGIVEGPDNAVIKLYKISNLLSTKVQTISMILLDDLRVHAPDIWNELNEFRKTIIQKNFTKIIEQGKKEGLIVDKPDVIILAIILSSVQAVVNPEFILNNNISMKNAAFHTLDIIFSGILTKQGRKLFKEFKSGSPNE